MNTRPSRAGGRTTSRALAVLALVPAFALLLATSASADVSAVSGGATGATATVSGVVNASIGPVSEVNLAGPGGPITDSVASASIPGLLDLGVLDTSTQGTVGPGGAVQSSASVARVRVGTALLPLLRTGLVTSSCTSDETGSTGTSSIADVRALGISVPVNPAPNTTVSIAGLGTVIFNEQIVSGTAPADTAITVNAIHIIVDAPLIGTGDIVIAQSRCGVTGAGVVIPTGAVGGVLLTGLVAVGFGGYQIHRSRRHSAN